MAVPTGGDDGAAVPESLRGQELRRRASVGLFVVATRGLVVLGLGFVGYVVQARLLSPREFGLYAVGLVFVSVVALLSDGGLGAGLIRRAEPPELDELRALVGFQLVVTVALVVLVVAAAAPFGKVGWVTAILVGSTPLVAFQFPGRILLERSLDYRPVAIVEVSQVFTYHVAAIGLVLLGLGVWGLALAFVLRTAIGTLLMAKVSPVGLLWPLFSVRRIRPLMAFGIRFQATTGTEFVRDFGMNWAIAIVASISTLGLWSLVRRLMEAPMLLIGTFNRVAFSTMSRLVEAKEDSGALVERVAGIALVGTGAVLAGLAGSAEGLIPGVFGEQWAAASSAVPWTCLAFAISGSVSVAVRSYLYAVGDAAAVLRASSLQAVVAIAVTLPLLGTAGVTAVGLGWLASAVAEAFVLAAAARRRSEMRVGRVVLPALGVGTLSAVAGWGVTRSAGGSLPGSLAGGTTAAVGFVAGMLVVDRNLVTHTFRFTVRSVRAGVKG
jgi:O-antigen/teichoic acid export membrane protein